MRRQVPLAALLLATAVATLGCYESDFPMGPPSTAIDPHLLGKWRCVLAVGSTTQSLDLAVARRGDQQYDLTLDMPGEDTGHYRGHPTDVHGTTIVNLQELKAGQDPGAGRWDFVRATLLRPNVLDVEVVDDALFKGKPATAEGQRAVLDASIGRPELFADYCVCARVVPDKN